MGGFSTYLGSILFTKENGTFLKSWFEVNRTISRTGHYRGPWHMGWQAKPSLVSSFPRPFFPGWKLYHLLGEKLAVLWYPPNKTFIVNIPQKEDK
jgi:hypothetical protein